MIFWGCRYSSGWTRRGGHRLWIPTVDIQNEVRRLPIQVNSALSVKIVKSVGSSCGKWCVSLGITGIKFVKRVHVAVVNAFFVSE